MDIVALIERFWDSLFEAREDFFDQPIRLAEFEGKVADASHKFASEFIGGVLTELDGYLMDNLKRQERFVIQRKRKKQIISTVGDMCFERTLCKDRDTGKYV